MNTNTSIGEDVYDLTPQQLGTVLYHIANNTRVSLDYTGKYKQDALNRASSILCNAIELEPEAITADELEELCEAIMRETLVPDTYANGIALDGDVYKIFGDLKLGTV